MIEQTTQEPQTTVAVPADAIPADTISQNQEAAVSVMDDLGQIGTVIEKTAEDIVAEIKAEI